MSLKRLLLILGILGGTYVLVIVAYVSAFLLPTASGLRDDTEALLIAHQGAVDRVQELHDVVMGAENLLRGRAARGPLPADSAMAYRIRIEALLSAGVSFPRADSLEDIPPVVRSALDRAHSADSAVVLGVLNAVEALEAGAFEAAIASVTDADHERSQAEAALVAAQGVAMREVLARERQLQEATSAAVVVFVLWGVVGAVFVLACCLLLRARLYRPMGQLQRALGRVSAGDLATHMAVHPGDEMGRLAGLFNDMIAVLAEREADAQRRHRGLIERYGRILDETATALVVLNPAGMRVVVANERLLNDIGASAESLRGRSAEELWGAAPGLVHDVLREVANGTRERGVLLADQTRADGTLVKVEITAFLARDREAPEIICVVHDLTERRGLEYVHDQLARFALENQAVLQSGDVSTAFGKITELASELLGVEVAAVWLVDGGTLRCANSYDRRDQAHSEGALLSQSEAPAYFAALQTERVIAAVEATTDTHTSELTEYLAARGIGALLDVPLRREGQVVGVVCHEHVDTPRVWTPEEKVLATAIGDFVIRVIERDERGRAELGRRESEQRYHTMFENAAVGITEMDAEGRFLRANPTMQAMLGYSLEQLQEKTWRDITAPEDREHDDMVAAELRAGRLDVHRGEKRYVRRDGGVVWVETDTAAVRRDDGTLSHLITVAKDVSEARALRDQLAHAQRMDSIGRLAGGIAHDFNNLLTAVLGHAEMLRLGMEPGSSLSADIDEIEESARRATGLTRQLLTFARRQVVEASVVELDELAVGAERLLRRLLGENIEFVTELDAPGAMIRIDPQQFDQVIVNLSVNARDAMPDGGRITIRSRVVDHALYPELPIVPGEGGELVVLEVADNGKGMAAGVRERVFEPFFTTKEPGEGTGLGLATCYGIVRQAGGHIVVESTQGVGTVFRVCLPRVEGEEQAEPSRQAEPDFVTGKTVLVVEDADPVRRLIVDSLERKGYRVVEAEDGQEAVEVAEGFDGTIDLVVSDIVMPRMSGPKAVEAIRAERPDIRVLFISGYSADTLRDEALQPDGTAFLSKPFTPTELVRQVHALAEQTAGVEVGRGLL